MENQNMHYQHAQHMVNQQDRGAEMRQNNSSSYVSGNQNNAGQSVYDMQSMPPPIRQQ
jgi:hypothetical protein